MNNTFKQGDLVAIMGSIHAPSGAIGLVIWRDWKGYYLLTASQRLEWFKPKYVHPLI